MGLISIVYLLVFYGIFLALCGIVSVILIGLKAKTALASGGLSGLIIITIAYLISTGMSAGLWAGILVSFALFVVFAWRSTKTLFKIFELLQKPAQKHELNGKGIAFLIISLMAIVSLFVVVLQIVVVH